MYFLLNKIHVIFPYGNIFRKFICYVPVCMVILLLVFTPMYQADNCPDNIPDNVHKFFASIFSLLYKILRHLIISGYSKIICNYIFASSSLLIIVFLSILYTLYSCSSIPLIKVIPLKPLARFFIPYSSILSNVLRTQRYFCFTIGTHTLFSSLG